MPEIDNDCEVDDTAIPEEGVIGSQAYARMMDLFGKMDAALRQRLVQVYVRMEGQQNKAILDLEIADDIGKLINGVVGALDGVYSLNNFRKADALMRRLENRVRADDGFGVEN